MIFEGATAWPKRLYEEFITLMARRICMNTMRRVSFYKSVIRFPELKKTPSLIGTKGITTQLLRVERNLGNRQ